MNREKYQELLEIASDQVPFGVYGVEKGDYAELFVHKCSSQTQLKQLTRDYKRQGFKVYANGRQKK